jgi:hypothetical protein
MGEEVGLEEVSLLCLIIRIYRSHSFYVPYQITRHRSGRIDVFFVTI